MSFRPEENRRQRSASENVGLGVAIAAIGVGVGAALYYFMNKRETTQPEHLNIRTSISSDTFETEDLEQTSDSSFTTISAHSTTDTSINDSTNACPCSDISTDMLSSVSDSDSNSDQSDSNSSQTDSFSDVSDNESLSDSDWSPINMEFDEWSILNGIELPNYHQSPPRPTPNLLSLMLNRNNETQPTRDNIFRERQWTVDQCSICFETMSREDDSVINLMCNHYFHTKCILPWIERRNTCPNCRTCIESQLE